MTDHVARLYAIALAILVFSLTWAVVAAKPWSHEAKDPRLAALERRELRLRRESVRVQRVVERRFATYRRELGRREAAIAAANANAAAAAAPSVSVSGGSVSAPAASAAPAPAASSVSVVSVPPATSSGSS